MGAQSYQEIVSKATVSTDPQTTAMVQRVGSRITGVTDLRYPWDLKLIADDKQANAFALPGGNVAVYTGILPITRNEAGLAAVLGHEIGHVAARHGAASRDGAGSRRPVRRALLPWSRQQESEADHIGVLLMAKAGYDPHAAIDLWKRMQAASTGAAPVRMDVDAPLRDHPHPAAGGLDAGGPEVLQAGLPGAAPFFPPLFNPR